MDLVALRLPSTSLPLVAVMLYFPFFLRAGARPCIELALRVWLHATHWCVLACDVPECSPCVGVVLTVLRRSAQVTRGTSMLLERYVQCALSDMCRWLHHELWT